MEKPPFVVKRRLFVTMTSYMDFHDQLAALDGIITPTQARSVGILGKQDQCCTRLEQAVVGKRVLRDVLELDVGHIRHGDFQTGPIADLDDFLP